MDPERLKERVRMEKVSTLSAHPLLYERFCLFCSFINGIPILLRLWGAHGM